MDLFFAGTTDIVTKYLNSINIFKQFASLTWGHHVRFEASKELRKNSHYCCVVLKLTNCTWIKLYLVSNWQNEDKKIIMSRNRLKVYLKINAANIIGILIRLQNFSPANINISFQSRSSTFQSEWSSPHLVTWQCLYQPTSSSSSLQSSSQSEPASELGAPPSVEPRGLRWAEPVLPPLRLSRQDCLRRVVSAVGSAFHHQGKKQRILGDYRLISIVHNSCSCISGTHNCLSVFYVVKSTIWI